MSFNKVLDEIFMTTSEKPPTVLARLKDILEFLNKSCEPGLKPTWFNEECRKLGVYTAWDNIIREAIEEIEMHQRLNGELYKKLYG